MANGATYTIVAIPNVFQTAAAVEGMRCSRRSRASNIANFVAILSASSSPATEMGIFTPRYLNDLATSHFGWPFSPVGLNSTVFSWLIGMSRAASIIPIALPTAAMSSGVAPLLRMIAVSSANCGAPQMLPPATCMIISWIRRPNQLKRQVMLYCLDVVLSVLQSGVCPVDPRAASTSAGCEILVPPHLAGSLVYPGLS